jgi:uncharacterized protein YutE (UPF0331/DUF86 family)
MNWLQFIESLVRSLAWPVTVFALVFLLRTPLRQVLLTLTRLRYKDLELDFGRELKQLEEKARSINITPAQSKDLFVKKDSSQLINDAAKLAQEFPQAAVAIGWQAIEDELASAIMRLAISPDPPSHGSAAKNVQLLREDGVIDEATVELLNRMRKLRNMAVHHTNDGATVTSSDAAEFLALAGGVAERLRALRRP